MMHKTGTPETRKDTKDEVSDTTAAEQRSLAGKQKNINSR
jgi:hypothetical protein